MHLSDHDLQQLDEQKLERLDEKTIRLLSSRLLEDLKESRDRLNQTSSNSSRPPGSDAPWVKSLQDKEAEIEPPAECDNETYPVETAKESTSSPEDTPLSDEESTSPSSKKTTPNRKPGKQKGAQGFGRMQVFIPQHIVTHRPQTCAVCCNVLTDLKATTYTAWDEIDLCKPEASTLGIHIHCTRHQQQTILCLCGHENRTQPHRAPPDPNWDKVSLSEWHLFGPRFAAATVMLSLRFRLSRSKIREFWQEYCNVSISTGAINTLISEAGRACEPLEAELVQEIQAAALANVDETSWKEFGKLLWLWTFVTTQTVLFRVGSRGREILAAILFTGQFTGKLMSDGWHVYREYLNRLRCWSHLIRKAEGLGDSVDLRVSRVGLTILACFDQLMMLIYEARKGQTEALDALKCQGEQKIAALRILCELHQNDDHKKLRAFSRELLYDWSVIFRPVGEPDLPLTNNAAETSLRHWVISRQISHGTRTPAGTRAFTLLASVTETCRRRNADVRGFLTEVIAAARTGQVLPSLPLMKRDEKHDAICTL